MYINKTDISTEISNNAFYEINESEWIVLSESVSLEYKKIRNKNRPINLVASIGFNFGTRHIILHTPSFYSYGKTPNKICADKILSHYKTKLNKLVKYLDSWKYHAESKTEICIKDFLTDDKNNNHFSSAVSIVNYLNDENKEPVYMFSLASCDKKIMGCYNVENSIKLSSILSSFIKSHIRKIDQYYI
ncbi:hypothetical protein vBSdyM006_220 [Shigella phage vB_SdyM_006]|nr:hypothetical protein vBSdyM006_220 [Shigella phage vB_SdyM_006]